MSSIKLIDTFLFNGDWILKARLKYLFDCVDEFVIIESIYTFNGEKKEILFKDTDEWKDVFKKYQSKIHFIVVEDYLYEIKPEWHKIYSQHSWFREQYAVMWQNEHYQRDASYQYIRDKYNDTEYIVNIGDVDEIPDITIFDISSGRRQRLYENMKQVQQPIYFQMDFFYYNFQWRKPELWHNAFVIHKDLFLTNGSPTFFRVHYTPTYIAPKAGWHFSYFMNIHDIQRKIQSFSHQEYNKHPWTDLQHIHQCITTGKDLFHRGNSQDLVFDGSLSFPDVFHPFITELASIQSLSQKKIKLS